MMKSRRTRDWLDEHMFGLIILGVTIFVIITGSYAVFIFTDEPIDYTTKVDKTIILSETSVTGIVDSIRVLDNGKTKIRLNEGKWAFGIENIETYWVETNLELIPTEIIKITITKKEGIGCMYFDSNGVGHEYPARQFNINLYGERCGKYYEYEVEKIK